MLLSKRYYQPNVTLPSEITSHVQLKMYAKYNRRLTKLSFTNTGSAMDSSKILSLKSLIRQQKHLAAIKIHIDELGLVRHSTFLDLLEAVGQKLHQKSLQISTTYEYFDTLRFIKRFTKIIRKLNDIEKVSLCLPKFEDPKAFLMLFHSMTHQRLKDLSIESLLQKQYPVAPTIDIGVLTMLLSKITTLQYLKLDILEKNASVDDSILVLRESLGKLTQMKGLSLGFDEDMELCGFLPVMHKSLRKLELRSLGNKISGLGFLNLAESLEQLSELRSLSIDIDGIEKATEPTAENVAKSLSKLQNLREINLKIHRATNSNNLKVKRFLEFLPNLRLLKKMKIELYKTVSAKKAINEISQSLKSQKSLEELVLSFEDCGLGDLELSGVADGISSQKNLKHIQICLKENKGIVNPGIIELFKTLRDIPTLKKLFIDLSGIPHLNDQSLRGFIEIVNRVPNLTALGLLLSECKNLTDEWLIKFSDALRSQKELKAVVLGLTQCSMISDKGFIRLTKSLSNCKDLLQLGFGIEKCQITTKGIQHLKELLEELKNIKYLQLKLSGFMKVSYQAIVEIGNSLKKLKNLQRVGMDTYPFSVSKDEPPVFIEDCSNQPSLWRFL